MECVVTSNEKKKKHTKQCEKYHINSIIVGSPQTTDATTGTPQTTQTTQSSSAQPPTESSTQSGSTTAKPTNSPGNDKDKCDKEGFMADSSNCKKFYRCVDNGKGGFTKYDFECPEGTAWSQEVETCDYADKVTGCAKSSESSGSTTQQTTGNFQFK